MNGARIPPEILITALASRLVDLQSARMEDDVVQLRTPEPTPRAAQRAHVAAALLFSLDKALLDGKTEYVGVHVLNQELQDAGYPVTEGELQFCARFLGAEREIRYVGDEQEPLSTRDMSQLVRYQARQNRVKLTLAGQHFVKMVRHTGEWLYTDKDIEKLSRAIRTGLFEDIGRLCGEIQSTLRMENEKITALRESPSSEAMLSQYIEHREHFSEMLDNALRAALDAKESLTTEDTRRHLDTFNSTRLENPIGRPALKEAVSVVHQATESLSRNWSGLLEDLQDSKRQQMGVLRFDKIIDAFVEDPPTEKAMTAFLAGCCGWIPRAQMVGVDAMIGQLSPAIEPKDKEVLVFDLDPTAPDGDTELQAWLDRHSHAVLEAVKQGPVLLTDLIQNAGLPGCPIRDITEFSNAIGMYAIEDADDTLFIEVAQLPGFVATQGWGHHIGVSNIALRRSVREKEM